MAGASGYSFKEWKGTFYPSDLKPDVMLAWYSERLPTVEINNTFYRTPPASVMEGWAGATPADFRFAIKASRRITHISRLKAESVAEPLAYLYRNLTAPLAVGKAFVIGDIEGMVHWFARDSGEAVLRLPTDGSAIKVPPAASGLTLLVVTSSGGLFAFRPE